MKLNMPTTSQEIVLTVMSILDKMTGMEKNIENCQEAIASHAEESKKSNQAMNNTINGLQFSVGGMQETIKTMQQNLEVLTQFSVGLSAIGRFIALSSKVILGCITIAGGVLAIMKYLGRL